jgi:tRNA A-37 threonylcarbamoyl transferase component Bud32
MARVYKETVKKGSKEYLITETKLGEGVDGEVYLAEIGDKKVVVKIMPREVILEANDKEISEIEKIEEFRRVNMLGMEKGFGPRIYDIVEKGGKVYMFMENLDKDMGKKIEEELKKGVKWEEIKGNVGRVVGSIHRKMMESGVTLGDDNVNNYMSRGREWVRIDYTLSKKVEKIGGKELEKFKWFYVVNPKGEMEKIRIII